MSYDGKMRANVWIVAVMLMLAGCGVKQIDIGVVPTGEMEAEKITVELAATVAKPISSEDAVRIIRLVPEVKQRVEEFNRIGERYDFRVDDGGVEEPSVWGVYFYRTADDLANYEGYYLLDRWTGEIEKKYLD